MPASQARRLCPTAIVIPPDFTAYREKSREVWELVARPARPPAVDGARRGLRRPHRRREAAARAARADRRGARADRHPDLGRRRAQPPDRQVLLGPRQARRLRRDGPRGGVHPLRAPRRRAACRGSARRPPSAWPSSATHGRPAAGGRRGPARRPLRRPHGPLPEGARVVPRRLAGGDRARRGEVASRPSARSTRTSPRIASWRTILRTLRRELCEGLQRKSRQGRTVAIKVRLADWTTVTRARTLPDATNDDRARHRDRAGAAARLRAAAGRCACSACGWRRSTTSSRDRRRRPSRPSASWRCRSRSGRAAVGGAQ